MKRWRHIERVLLIAGLAAVDVWLLANADKAIYQAWQSWAFERELQGQQATAGAFVRDKTRQLSESLGIQRESQGSADRVATPRPSPVPPTTATDGIIGRLTIPRLHLSAMVREGAGEDTLRVALGHIPNTALPGEPGNVGIAGHRDTLFRKLRSIRKNDEIVFETLRGKYVYRVQSTEIVNPRDVSVLDPKPSRDLTLVTCYPFYYVGSAPDRFIVSARQMGPPASVPD